MVFSVLFNLAWLAWWLALADRDYHLDSVNFTLILSPSCVLLFGALQQPWQPSFERLCFFIESPQMFWIGESAFAGPQNARPVCKALEWENQLIILYYVHLRLTKLVNVLLRWRFVWFGRVRPVSGSRLIGVCFMDWAKINKRIDSGLCWERPS